MSWIELHIKTTAEHAHSLSDELMLLEAQAVTFQDAANQPIYEPAPGTLDLWPETIVIGLFDKQLPLSPILNYLEQQQAIGFIQNFRLHHLADQDWERICLQYFQPIQFGPRLWICPSWHTPPDANAVNVILDPGLAFGTGTHPTTALCLAWLDENISQPAQVIDYGCGSGILGLAALKLGAKQVIAIDHDPQALQATQQNAERNHIIAPQLITCLPNALANKTPAADVLIANILAQPLIELAAHFMTLTHARSQILLSGILLEQVDQVQKAYSEWIDFDIPPRSSGLWACLAGRRK